MNHGLITFIALAAVALFVNGRYVKRELARRDEMIGRLQSDIAAIVSGAAGIGEHLAGIDRQLRDVRERQNQLETSTRVEGSYGQAIRLVQEGADIDQLVRTCGLVRDEAELIRTFYQRRQAG